ncbi:MAG: hypothetical protein RLZZ99_731, partial [Actinomycetota bacterium]
MKMATVNPIPAVLPVAKSARLEVPIGNSASRNLSTSTEVRNTPIGFPATKPSTIPQAIGDSKAACQAELDRA